MFLLFLSQLSLYCYAQIHPNQDSHWILNDNKSDDFDGSYLDGSKWDKLQPGVGYNWGGGGQFLSSQTSVNAGQLVLTVEPLTNSPFYSYKTGGIRSENSNYSYGFFEIEAKLPGAYIDGIPNGQGFWPCFWTYYVEEENDCRIVHDEIDILEPSGTQYADPRVNVLGWHDEDPDCIEDHIKINEFTYVNNTPLFLEYHKYGVEWLPDRLIFYFDETPIYEVYNHPKIIMEPQYVVIDQQIDGNTTIEEDMPLPQTMDVNYFRYHELIFECDQNIQINSNSDIDSYTPSVKNDITVGSTGSIIDFSQSNVTVLRASNSITIKNNTIIPLGTTLAILPTTCNN